MKVLLDTSAYSMLMRGDDSVASLLNAADEVHLSAVVVGELLAGFKKESSEQGNIETLNPFSQHDGYRRPPGRR